VSETGKEENTVNGRGSSILDQKTVDELLDAIIVRVESAIRGEPPSLL
jgi:hypothetical protein